MEPLVVRGQAGGGRRSKAGVRDGTAAARCLCAHVAASLPVCKPPEAAWSWCRRGLRWAGFRLLLVSRLAVSLLVSSFVLVWDP